MVGPNGSGKSNVVDAIAWVMGEQGAKSLRGGKMDDVIFAGTSRQSAAGSRGGGTDHRQLRRGAAHRLHRGDDPAHTVPQWRFEYAINGQTCRLLDVQELLADSGIGREMHVIVGQGRLDAILHASPEDRRGFIEEAAGVLKHRRRRRKPCANWSRSSRTCSGSRTCPPNCAGNSSHWGGRRRWHGGLPPFRPMSEMHG